MVAEIKDDGIVGQPRLVDLAQMTANERIHLTESVIVLRPILPDGRMIGMIGGAHAAGRIMNRLVGP